MCQATRPEAATAAEQVSPPAVHVIDHLNAGGAQALLFELASRIPGSSVLSLRGKPTASPYAWDRIYREKDWARGTTSILAGIAHLIVLCIRERRRAQFVAHLNAATVVLCLLKPILRYRLLVMVHASPRQWSHWYRLCFRSVIRFADVIIGGGEYHTRLLTQEGIAPEKLVQAGIGCPLLDRGPLPADLDIRKELGIAPEEAVALNVARMVQGKGQAEIIRAIAKLPDRRIVAIIVGDGPEYANLNRLAEELGVRDRVRFPGYRDDLHNFYRVASMFIMPCLDESMGVVILESLAYKLPILAYDSGCIAEFIKDGESGFLIPPNLDALVSGITRILDERPTLAPDRLARFSMEGMVERFRTFINVTPRAH